MTVFATATVTSCPAPVTCPVSSGLPAPSSTSSSGCSSTIMASLCRTCALTPTVILTTCAPATSTSGSTVAPGNPTSTTPNGASSATPNCPEEPVGRLFVDGSGMIYALYCGTEYLDPNVDILGATNFMQCIAACDLYNIQNFFNPSASCMGVSFFENTAGNNCYLKNSTNDPQAMNGTDSAELLTPQPPPGNSSSSISSSRASTVTVTSLPILLTSMPTASASGLGSVNVVTSKSK